MSPKSRTRKKRDKARHPRRPGPKEGQFRIQSVQSPFHGMTRAEADEAFIEAGREAGTIFDKSFGELQKHLLTPDPVLLLSVLAFYSHFGRIKSGEPLREEHPILQHHIELVQSLVLRNTLDNYEGRPAIPPLVTEVRELAYEAAQTFFVRRYANLNPSMSGEERHRLRVLEGVRSHTQAIRNWGYPQQIRRIVTDLFAPLDDEIERRKGVRAGHLITVGARLMMAVEERVNAHIGKLQPMLSARNLAEAVERYYQLLTQSDSSPENMLKLFRERKTSLREAKAMLLSYSDLWLPDYFTFTFEDFVNLYPGEVSRDALQKVAETWILSFGDLADAEPEHFFMANPVWTRPLIKTGDDEYFIPIVGLFLSFCLEQMEALIADDAELQERYELRRAKYLEHEVERLFVKAFPSAKVYRGSLWTDPTSGKEFENDLLVLIDSYLIVAEAKSGKVSDPARRGSELRIRREINRLIVEPSVQAKRFADYLQTNLGAHSFMTRDGRTNEFDTSQVYETIRLNITLDLLANIHASWTDLRRAGLLPIDVDMGPTMHLADLETIFETLQSACEKLHYLVRRAQFELNAVYFADESDLLVFYLETGFNVGEAEFDDSFFMLYGLSERLDPYFMREWSGEEVDKPRRRYTQWWQHLLERVEGLSVARWTEFGYMLLNFIYDEQKWFEREFRRVQENVDVHWRTPGHDNAYIAATGPPQRRNAIVGVAYKRVSTEERNQIMWSAGREALEREPVDRVLIIGIDVEKRDSSLPYHVMACFFRKDEKEA
jgi:hypothetical protein